MKRVFSMMMAVLLLAVGLTGCARAQAMAPEAPARVEAAPLAANAATLGPTATPNVTVAGTIEGTVLAKAPNDIIINMKNGNTINFMMNYIADTEAMVGDEVKIEYAGNLADRPEAVTITVTEKSPVQTLSGTVFQHDSTSIFIQISSQQVFGFVVDKETATDGAADYVVAGDTVTLTYSGDLYGTPTAVQITITEAVKNRDEKAAPTAEPTNKSLDGLVSKVSATSLTMRTSRSQNYTFKINNNTRVTGKYSLEVGARVTVYYDGYASKSPAAKAVNVYAPPDPNPTATPKPSTKTVTGIVDSFGGMYLALTSGVGFDCAYATYSGNSDGQVGDQARVTYYVGSDKQNYATYITFTSVSPDPTPTPKPKPSTKTASGIVDYFGGMYLSLDNGMGFDCTYASYSGDGDRIPGDKAQVTYYVGDDGVYYATKIKFTTLYQATDPVPAPEPEPEPKPVPDPDPDPEPDFE